MKYSAIAGAFCLLFSLGIVSAKVPVKLVLSPEELRQIVVELVKSEVKASLSAFTPEALAVESQVQEQLLGIQQSINETLRSHDVLRSDFDNQMEQVRHECGRAAVELAPPIVSNGGALNASTLRTELQAIASDIVAIKEGLERVQRNIHSRPTEVSATRVSPTETIPLSTTTRNSTRRPDTAVERAFETAVASKSARIGQSFNGSTIEEISSVVSSVGYERKFATVEFVNYLNVAVTDFQLYHNQSRTPVYHQAPSQIAANTKEVFTFFEPSCCFQNVAFSYSIPHERIRIATRLRLYLGDGVGLSFLSENDSLETYYRTNAGPPGAYDFKLVPQMNQTSYPDTTELFIRYQNLYAKATMNLRGYHKANLKIELVGMP